MTVIALVAFATDTLSMYKGEIADLSADVASPLIDEGYVKEYSESGGGGDSDFVVTITGLDLSAQVQQVVADKTYAETYEAFSSGQAVRFNVVGVGQIYPMGITTTPQGGQFYGASINYAGMESSYFQLLVVVVTLSPSGASLELAEGYLEPHSF